jgi:hypothetical protein
MRSAILSRGGAGDLLDHHVRVGVLDVPQARSASPGTLRVWANRLTTWHILLHVSAQSAFQPHVSRQLAPCSDVAVLAEFDFTNLAGVCQVPVDQVIVVGMEPGFVLHAGEIFAQSYGIQPDRPIMLHCHLSLQDTNNLIRAGVPPGCPFVHATMHGTFLL